MVVVRTVVFTTTARLCGPVDKLVIEPFATEQDAPLGSPVQLIETDPGKPDPVGLTCAVYVAALPAFTVALFGVNASL